MANTGIAPKTSRCPFRNFVPPISHDLERYMQKDPAASLVISNGCSEKGDTGRKTSGNPEAFI
jgi:hypothetical protein